MGTEEGGDSGEVLEGGCGSAAVGGCGSEGATVDVVGQWKPVPLKITGIPTVEGTEADEGATVDVVGQARAGEEDDASRAWLLEQRDICFWLRMMSL